MAHHANYCDVLNCPECRRDDLHQDHCDAWGEVESGLSAACRSDSVDFGALTGVGDDDQLVAAAVEIYLGDDPEIALSMLARELRELADRIEGDEQFRAGVKWGREVRAGLPRLLTPPALRPAPATTA